MPPATPARWASVRAVLLDVDDTLIDTRAAMHAAGAAGAAAAWPQADPERIGLAGKRFRDDPEGHFAAYTRGEMAFAAMREARIGEVARWLGVRDWEGSAGVFLAAYDRVFMDCLRAFPDARACVESLRATGIAVGLLTNSGADYTVAKLARTGLAGLTEVVCTRDTLGIGKPDARAFHEACRQLDSAPEVTGYVGDEWVPDARGAADAGLTPAWLVRDPGSADAARGRAGEHGIPVIAGLDEVPGLCAGS